MMFIAARSGDMLLIALAAIHVTGCAPIQSQKGQLRESAPAPADWRRFRDDPGTSNLAADAR
jgi:hypothetical protein